MHKHLIVPVHAITARAQGELNRVGAEVVNNALWGDLSMVNLVLLPYVVNEYGYVPDLNAVWHLDDLREIQIASLNLNLIRYWEGDGETAVLATWQELQEQEEARALVETGALEEEHPF